MITKPSSYLDWTDGDPLKVTNPPPAQKFVGWTEGEPPPFEYMNWLFYTTDLWIKWLDQQTDNEAATAQKVTQSRLINGGYWSWVLSSGTLAWNADFNVSIPSIPDADNNAVAGSVVLTDGQVAYVNANIPYNLIGDVTNGSDLLTNVKDALNLSPGMTVTGTGIPVSTTVLNIIDEGDGEVTVQISNMATATNTGVTLTFSSSGALTVLVANISALVPGPSTMILARRVGNVVFIGINATQMVLQNQESKLLNQVGYLTVSPVVLGETLAYGNAVYLSIGAGDGGRTAGSAYKADSSVALGAKRHGAIGFIIVGGTVGQTGYIVEAGHFVTSGLVAGSEYYINPATPGGITSTKPTTAYQWVIPVGRAISTTIFQIDLMISDSPMTTLGDMIFAGPDGQPTKLPIGADNSVVTAASGVPTWAPSPAVPVGGGMPYFGSTAPTGWVLADGKTIGSATSGGTERANADTLTLFTLLWNSFSNTQLPIQDSTGTPTTRGVSAAADFTANKRMPLPDLRGRVVAGLDNMGGAAASRLTATTMTPDGVTNGASGGEQTHQLTTAELASHNHTQNPHTHRILILPNAVAGVGGSPARTDGSFGADPGIIEASVATNNAAGGDTPHNNTQPTFVTNYIIKL